MVTTQHPLPSYSIQQLPMDTTQHPLPSYSIQQLPINAVSWLTVWFRYVAAITNEIPCKHITQPIT